MHFVFVPLFDCCGGVRVSERWVSGVILWKGWAGDTEWVGVVGVGPVALSPSPTPPSQMLKNGAALLLMCARQPLMERKHTWIWLSPKPQTTI